MTTKITLANLRDLWAEHKEIQEALRLGAGPDVHRKGQRNWKALTEALDSLLE